MRYCPNCGANVDPDGVFCSNCGSKLPKSAPVREIGEEKTPPVTRAQYYKPGYSYRPTPYRPRPYHPSMKAPMIERIIAYFVDSVINQVCCFYSVVKDGIREGQSIGKGFFEMRVVDFATGQPATYEQSCIRNCLCGWLDGCCCYLMPFIDEDGRRIGDHVAGTIVIVDR
ncbi:MAG: zinc ribbon domain-containing protein [Candidatus Hodarchaeales archaeon]